MERLAGAVERFVCGSGGRVEVSKCRAVLGTAFAGVGRSEGIGLAMSKGGERACSVAFPQPAANGAFAGVGRSEGIGLACILGQIFH